MNDQNNEYEISGPSALRETAGDGETKWLDFKQGRGDTYLLRIVNILGIRMKPGYRGAPAKKVLEFDVEIFEDNGKTCDPPQLKRTNPTAHWCKPITKAIDELATKHGWDGDDRTYAKYVPAAYGYVMRMTRNDNESSNVGRIDCKIVGPLKEQLANTPTVDKPFTDDDFATYDDDHCKAIRAASTMDELRTLFVEAWRSTTNKDLREVYTQEKDNTKANLDLAAQDVPSF